VDPFRTAPLPCPVCHTGLREFGRRLVCDSCGGMQLDIDDFGANTDAVEDVRLVDDGTTTLVCPRCLAQMRGGFVQVAGRRFDHQVAHCERDGMWISAEALEDIFTRVGRNMHRGGGEGRTYGGTGTVGYVRLYDPRRKPIQRAPWTSAFAGRDLACPRCVAQLLHLEHDRWSCGDCKGAFVENAALVAMVGEMTGSPWELPPPTGGEGTRTCAVCTATMLVEQLEGVEIDRCPDHGIWFDPAELADALRHASKIDEPHGLGAWLKRLF
jgi:Zn-finger nucleic acid-binding protein